MPVVFKRTKILATVGPACNSEQAISEMIDAGVNGFRLNFSHGDYAERDQQIAWIRSASQRVGKPVAILQDLQGPKIRLGELTHNSPVKVGDTFVLAYEATHRGDVVPVQYNLAEKVEVGQSLYISDGKIRTKVVEIIDKSSIRVKASSHGILMSRKGINLPDTDMSGDILTPKDILDIEFGASRDIDYVALSFVQHPDDIHNLRQRLKKLGSTAAIIAKIETKAALRKNVLNEIVQASDGVMIARGDLAVEAGPEVVPVAQRRIVGMCRHYGKLSIVATQMMASMVNVSEPTRAEVGDVATAVILGADCVMLSDETAVGKFPIVTVESMKKVIVYTQQHSLVDPPPAEVQSDSLKRDSISSAAVGLAEQLEVDAIVVETKSGATAANVAAHRPDLPIVSVTSEPRAAQQLALWYANKSFLRPDATQAGQRLAGELVEQGFFGKRGPARVVILSGVKPGVVGTTNTIQYQVIE